MNVVSKSTYVREVFLIVSDIKRRYFNGIGFIQINRINIDCETLLEIMY